MCAICYLQVRARASLSRVLDELLCWISTETDILQDELWHYACISALCFSTSALSKQRRAVVDEDVSSITSAQSIQN